MVVNSFWIDCSQFIVIPISGSDTITILVGNKCDLEDKREVDEADIRVSVPLNKMQVNSTS